MCGITGYYSPKKCELMVNRIVEMTDLIRHRGPDDEGYVFIETHSNISIDAAGVDTSDMIKANLRKVDSLDEVRHNLAFGHRRYAIIDLTPGGHQPFWDEDRSVCVSFNGEIYNYIELRNELEQKGHKFLTPSDTEVLVKAYKEWGVGCFQKFNGTWALSLYDMKERKLLLSRDRIGKNPLYYTIQNNILYWSSEIKSLLHACGADTFSINKQAIYDYINHAWRDLDNSTFWEEIHTLPAACYAFVDNSLNFQMDNYWTIPKERFEQSEITFDDAKKQLRNLLVDALEIRLRSDIPIGFALSGGMDSSALIALYAKVLHRSTVSFTVKFSQKGANEESFACMVAESCGKLVDYRVIEPSFNDFWKDADEYIWLMEEPFHNPVVHIEQLLQKKLKSQGFGVIINGNGGDEIFAGYEYIYFQAYLDYLLRKSKYWAFIKESFSWGDKDLKAFIRTIRSTLIALLTYNSSIKNKMKKYVMKKENSFLQGFDDVEERNIPKNFNEIMIGNMGQWLMNYWLRNGNKNYFAIPMETRSPFLDYRLVEFAFRLPPEYLIHNGWHKFILRKAMEDLLPRGIIWRINKMGFPFPLSEWLESSKHIIEKNVKIINCPYVDVEQLFEKYDILTKSNPDLLWRYISLLLWWKRVVLKQPLVSL